MKLEIQDNRGNPVEVEKSLKQYILKPGYKVKPNKWGDILKKRFGKLLFIISLVLFVLTIPRQVYAQKNYEKHKLQLSGIHKAAADGDLAKVKKLLKNNSELISLKRVGSSDGTSLYYAAMEGQLETVKYLISKGADINAKTRYGETLLHAAVYGDLRVVKYLLKQGLDVKTLDFRNYSTLHFAAFSGKLEIIKFLISKGLDVNARGEGDFTPLLMAVMGKKVQAVALLIEKGADINAESFEKVPAIYYAITFENGDARIVDILIKNGADVNEDLYDGNTPLHFAARNGRLDIVKLLVKNGANIDARNDFQRTPFIVARNKGIEKYLLRRGAKVDNEIILRILKDKNWRYLRFLLLYSREIQLKYLLPIFLLVILALILLFHKKRRQSLENQI